ncbi:MAG: DbpA RNA binding domain-containing protein, partial [Oscillospiraceae bacterium]|nr:DbpA RNA binding domain-containing protein [Oscillospiraceae bacterium]
DELTEALVSAGYKAAGLHGDMKQASRTQVLSAFKTGRINILIATDVAARGIDVEGVDMVFNYDLPQDNEYYIHRIGRTGRAGKSGRAYSIISGRKQFYELRDISKFIKTDIPREELPDRGEIIARKTERVTEKLAAAIESGKYASFREQIEKLCASGVEAEDIAAALLGMRLSKEIKNIPEITGFSRREPVSAERGSRGRRGKTVKVEISAGRSNSLAPNFVLGALVEATGMPGKSFGKIDIYDRFTTVEVPEADKEHVLDAMSGVKINGQRVTVKPYEGRGERIEDDRRRGSGRRSKPAPGGRPRARSGRGRPGYENRRKG